MERLIRRIIKVDACVDYHERRWWVRVALAFPLALYFRGRYLGMHEGARTP